ncbi:pyridoxal-phosphate dependent enzyme [Yinghuangia seranimata]|uniref:pyridoxal-phosphate dependent enzyme n=1 Tax=Yinghuangia seranimata TaxID=408067 RepID=UPI00248BCEDC|nr:pyridoxal-phosphate dependent enzyme [Yinghuangia seranimata]MDI2131495.1 pyridoxal-phosphate dependent enzyme [Yinghuangia seranimata]
MLDTLYDLPRAHAVVARHLAPTPLVATSLVPGHPDALLKLETAQPVGAFKVRGALAALDGLPVGVRAVTASAGNHALGMAYAAGLTGRCVTVVVACDASPAKIAALRDAPVELVVHGAGFDEAEAHALKLAEAPGTAYVSAYAHPDVIAGQSSIGAELDAALGAGPLTVVCGVGGGGLAAGLALWARSRPGARVVGVEAEVSRAVSTAVAAGRVLPCEIGDSLADGLLGNIEQDCPTPGVLRDAERGGVVHLTYAAEPEIEAAMRALFTRHGLVVEGAAAVGLAALRAGRVPVHGRVVVVLTGRNIAPAAYAEVLTRG